MFEDWTKFISFLQSQSIQLNKFNFDKPLRAEVSNQNKRAKASKANRKDSKIDVCAEMDFNFSRSSQ